MKINKEAAQRFLRALEKRNLPDKDTSEESSSNGLDIKLYMEILEEAKAWDSLRVFNFFRDHIPKKEVSLFELNDILIPEIDDAFIYERAGGILISYLGNEMCPEKWITINPKMQYSYLGYGNNGKEWQINGDAGDLAGYGMKSRKITIKGSAGGLLGYNMEGGSIFVEGDISSIDGSIIKSGQIYLKGETIILK